MTDLERLGKGESFRIIDPEPFWTTDPNALFSSPLRLYPSSNLSLSAQLNAVSRCVVLLAMVGFMYSRSVRVLLVAAVILFSIHVFYVFKRDEILSPLFEGFDAVAADIGDQKEKRSLSLSLSSLYNNEKTKRVHFQRPSGDNPMCNVTLEDLARASTVHKRPAPPADAEGTIEAVNLAARDAVSRANPTHPVLAERIFADLGDQFRFESSMRNFYSMPNTEIPNDVAGFAHFCFGSMLHGQEDRRDHNRIPGNDTP
jgi:Family of unknown function (DUF5762)